MKMKISTNETFFNVVGHDSRLRDILVEFGFEPMANDVTFNTVGRAVTMKTALKHINKDVETINLVLREKNLEVEFYDE